MAAVELDPQFVKALRLLRSKSKDSGAQLRAMLDDAIRQKKGLAPAPRSPSIGKQHSRSVSSDRTTVERSEKEKKKDLDRLKKDLSELVDKPTDPKRARLESPGRSSGTSHSPSPVGSTSPVNRDSSGSEEAEYGDLQMNLEGFDCSCCVCKTFTQESSNKLMECSSCQNLYHQDCHSPPVSNQEASDPRLIWNCYKCTKKSGSSEKSDKEKGSSSSKQRSDKQGSSKSSSSSSSKRSSSSSSSKNKTDSGHGSSKSSKTKSGVSGSVGGSVSGSSGSGSAASSSSELSTSAKKRLKLLKKQAAAATNISKKTKAK